MIITTPLSDSSLGDSILMTIPANLNICPLFYSVIECFWEFVTYTVVNLFTGPANGLSVL